MTDEERELEAWKREYEILKRKCAELKRDNDELRQRLDKLESDNSWRQSADWAQRSGGTL